jgi:hypothetical protein
VSNVQQIEAPVRQDDLLARATPLGRALAHGVAREHF